jgi:GNAT superfamily N-acetyltransferase
VSDSPDIRCVLRPARPGEGDALLIAERGDDAVGELTLWSSSTPARNGLRTAFVGALRCDDRATLEALLVAAVDAARAAGCAEVLGPIDGSTWRRYRTVTWSDGSPSFPMEPSAPAWWPEAFERAGYTIAERYHSAVDEAGPTAAERTRCDERCALLAARGITIRTLDACDPNAALAAMYDLSIEGFAANPLAAPIAREDFETMYRPFLAQVPPQLALLAFESADGGLPRAAGFMFGFLVPGWPLAASGPALILKSIAVRNSLRGIGLGAVLLERCRLAGWELGAKRTIYALMHDDNRSARMVTPTARVLRRYAVHSRRCAP